MRPETSPLIFTSNNSNDISNDNKDNNEKGNNANDNDNNVTKDKQTVKEKRHLV